MPQQTPNLDINLPSDHPHAPPSNQPSPSNPVNLHGIETSPLDARDIQVSVLAPLTPLPSSPDEHERGTAKSFFGSRGASPSAGGIRDDTVSSSSMEGSVDGRARSLSTWGQRPKKVPAALPVGTEAQSGAALNEAPPSGSFSPTPSQDNSNPTSALASPTSTTAGPGTGPAPVSQTPARPETKKANKKRLQVLTRSKSLRAEDEIRRPKGKPAKKSNGQALPNAAQSEPLSARTPLPPSDKDRSFRDMMKSSLRDRSEDRAVQSDDDKGASKPRQRKEKKEGKERLVRDIKDKSIKENKPSHPLSSSLRQHNTSTFFHDFRNTSSNAAIGIGKAGKGLFSKFARGGSNNDKATVAAGDHIPSVLTLPLIEQTRLTRIAKSYDHCKDKTEFWMPALPWRCIDYLNGKCEEEGLYRVSGGLTKVKEWRKRFDTELDVNLLDEPDLYDSSIIASLFKEWIRELPEFIFPKSAQDRLMELIPVQREAKPSDEPVSQLIRAELQKLPPFNYYLLFAITCHLSLLLSHEDKNKMSLDNLYRCFNQSLNLEGRLFYTLVGDWRQCWAGCLTENEYLKAEYDYLQHPYPQFIQDHQESLDARADERAMSSSGSSAPVCSDAHASEDQRPATSHTQPSHGTGQKDEYWLSPVKKNQRSSSDVGVSSMRSELAATSINTT